MNEVHGVRRRAELRGLEALARSRVNVGVWTARLLATSGAMSAVSALVNGQWRSGFGLGLWAVGLAVSSVRIERGVRTDAWVLLLLFLLGAVGSLAVRGAHPFEIGIAFAALIGISVGVRGVTALARIRREQEEALR